MLAIDHAILTVPDPAATADRLADRAGLKAVPGGRHEGHGTGNWIVPLGSSYIELMTVVDHDEAEHSPMGRWVIERSRNGDRLTALCLRTDAIDEIAARIGDRRPEPMRRRREDGTEVQWRLAGLSAAMSDRCLPFFIQWDIDEHDHPGRMPTGHSVDVDGIAWVEYGGDGERLAAWLGDHNLPIRGVDERPGPRRLAVATSAGQVIVNVSGAV